MVLAASVSATSFPQEVLSEEIEWTSTSRALSHNSGRPWTRGSTEASAAFISAHVGLRRPGLGGPGGSSLCHHGLSGPRHPGLRHLGLGGLGGLGD